MKILRVEFENLAHFKDGRCCIDLMATDRVMKDSGLYQISRSLHTQNIVAFVGLNATGKTTVLRLLNAALQIVVNNWDLSTVFIGNGMIQNDTVMRVLFFYNGTYYLLESVLGRKNEGNQKIFFKEEILAAKGRAQVRSKKDFDDFKKNTLWIKRRSDLGTDIHSYLKDTISIVVSVTQGNNCRITEYLALNHVNLVNTVGQTPREVLDVFDESIESFAVEPDGDVMHCKVKFKGNSQIYDVVDMLRLNNIVSAGTIKGQGIIGLASSALYTGGCLLVDEIEAHLNKELVRVILDLFKKSDTNPLGACLIFSTHYAELLDFVDRKDNIYVTRKQGNLISVNKYSNEYRRNDVKKSDVFLSNLLKGTAPSYEKIKRMRESICRH